ncbi:MAG: hypothetical protein KFB93_00620 [Simkaniaceae bacterium]|nr:MAG: hypothetical protein KFB93_00620 [Simkaniaceae bacterium]
MSVSATHLFQPQCSICLDEVLPPLQKTDTFCRHTFHKVCLETWLKTGDSCPICRQNLIGPMSFEQITEAVEKYRANLLSLSEVKQLWERYEREQGVKRNETSRIRSLSIEETTKEFAELQKSDFRDGFSVMKMRLMKERIENSQRRKKSNEDLSCALIFVVALCIFMSLPNVKLKR